MSGADGVSETVAAVLCDPRPASREAAVAELDRLVAAMETGQMQRERLLASCRRRAQLPAFCRERLQALEDRVKVPEEGPLRPWSAE